MIGASGVFFWWQPLLDFLGTVLQTFYSFIGNYGLAIILLTVAIRLVLLPLGLKQIRSMHQMQAVQPKVKALQAKYKGNKQKLNEETMKLYREHGVSPLGGCWPMFLQIPVLAALYSVLQYPQHPPHLPCDEFGPRGDQGIVICVEDGSIRSSIEEQLYIEPHAAKDVNFLGMNLLCSAQNAGTSGKELTDNKIPEDAPDWQDDYRNYQLDCGGGIPSRIPYYVLAALMIGTTYYQSRQMQKANPAGSSQQQTMTRVMPLLFGVWGFLFPAGLVLYWTTSNLWQIGQQHFVLKAKREAEAEGGPIVPPPSRRRPTPSGGRPAPRGPSGAGKGGSSRAVPAKGTKKPASGSGSGSGSGSRSSKGGTSGSSGGAKQRPPSPPPRKGWLSGVIERAEQSRSSRSGGNGAASGGSSGSKESSGPSGSAPAPEGTTGGAEGGSQGSNVKGSNDGGDRKKRRKR